MCDTKNHSCLDTSKAYGPGGLKDCASELVYIVVSLLQTSPEKGDSSNPSDCNLVALISGASKVSRVSALITLRILNLGLLR